MEKVFEGLFSADPRTCAHRYFARELSLDGEIRFKECTACGTSFEDRDIVRYRMSDQSRAQVPA